MGNLFSVPSNHNEPFESSGSTNPWTGELVAESGANVENSTRRLIFIEGNISSGKSTLIRNLQNKGFVVFEEPVEQWTTNYKDEEGVNALELFYQDKKTHGFAFQMMSLRTRWQVIKQALKALNNNHGRSKTVFVERSLLTDKNSFALGLREKGDMTALQWKIYNEILLDKIDDVKHLFKGLEVGYLYLRTSPQTCLSRKNSRARPEEKTIPLEYFISLHEKYDEWLGKITWERAEDVAEPEENSESSLEDGENIGNEKRPGDLIKISFHEVINGDQEINEVVTQVLSFCSAKSIVV